MNQFLNLCYTRKAQRTGALMLAIGSLNTAAQAESLTWGNGGTDANFATAGNWTGGTLSTDDVLTFGSSSFSTTLTQDSASLTSIGGLIFAADALSYTINSATAMTFAGDITVNGGTQTLAMATIINSARAVSIASGSKLIFGGGSTTFNHSVNGGTTTFTGLGTFELTTSGSFIVGSAGTNSVLNLSGLATFNASVGDFLIGAGSTAIAGSVTLATNNAITATRLSIGSTAAGATGNSLAYGTLNLGTSNTLNLDTINVGVGSKATNNSNLKFASTSSSSTVTLASKTNPGIGKTTINAGVYNTSSGSPNFTGSLDFTGGTLTANTVGNMTLGLESAGNIGSVSNAGFNIKGAFTLDGSTSSVIADTVTLGRFAADYGTTRVASGTGFLTVGGTLTIKNGKFQANQLLLAQKQIGTAAAANAVNVATGTVDVRGGELIIAGAGSKFELGNATNLTGVSAAQTVASLLITGGKVTSNVAITTASTVANPVRTILTLDGGILDMSDKAIGSLTNVIGGNGGGLNLRKGTLQNVNTINGDAGLTQNATNDGDVLRLLGTMVYTGATTVSKGTLQIGGGGTIGKLGNTDQDVNLSIEASVIDFFRSDETSITNKISGLGQVMVSSGIVTLTGANNYTGVTTLKAGALSVGSIGDGGVTSGNLGSASNAAANLVFDGGTLKYTGTAASTDRNFTINTGKTATIDIANELTLAGGVASGTGAITKTGTGKLVITGSNGNSGETTISAGTLQIGSGGTSGSLGAGQINNSGILNINRSDAVTIANKITGTGQLTISGGGTVSLTNAANDYSGETTISAGTLQIGSGGTTGTLGSGQINNSGILDIKRSDAISIANKITGTGKLVISGAGTVSLTNAANDYSGGTTLSQGTLSLDAAGVLGTSGTILMNGGELKFSANNTSDLSSRIKIEDGKAAIFNTNGQNVSFATGLQVGVNGTGGLTKTGAGTLTLGGTNTYTGSTTVSEGKLVISGTFAGALTVDSVLGGNSSFGGNVTVSTTGTLAAGNSIGTMNFANGLTENGTLDVELSGANLADLYNVTGLLALGANSTVSFSILEALTGNVYVFATYTTWNGTQFGTVTGAPSGWTIDYNYQGNNSFALVAVPEPGAVALGLFGSALLFARRRRA
jgi:fibronectin-binding autotransporter adhesin